MKKIKYLYSIIIILILFNIINIIYNVIKSRSDSNMPVNKSYEEMVIYSYIKYECSKIDQNLKIVDQNLDTLKLKSVIDGCPKIVLYYNEYNCLPCVDRAFETLNEYTNKLNQLDLMILTTYENAANIKITNDLNNLRIPIYNVPGGIFQNQEAFSIPKPLVFLLDHEFILKKILLIDQYNIEYLINYLESFKEADVQYNSPI